MDIDVVTRFFLVFSSLFVIVDPLGSIPTFVSLIKDHSKAETKRIVLKATIFGPLILTFFSLFGVWVFRFLQIDLNAFRAAGGMLLLFTAFEMLRAKNKECQKCSPEELNSPLEREDLSLVPVAIPMLAGPGAITSVMVFSTDHAENHLIHFSVILVAIALTFLISYFVLRSSVLIKEWLGRSGITVMQRIMGLLLSALSIQFVVQGLVALGKTYWS